MILLFVGPYVIKILTIEEFFVLAPANYIPYIQRQDIKLIVRDNKKCYNKPNFVRAGMRYMEHY